MMRFILRTLGGVIIVATIIHLAIDGGGFAEAGAIVTGIALLVI